MGGGGTNGRQDKVVKHLVLHYEGEGVDHAETITDMIIIDTETQIG